MRLGTGGMANRHVGRFAKIPSVSLAACLDVDRERAEMFARKHALERVATGVDELPGLGDAAVAATPDPFHAPISLSVLRAGKHRP